MKKNCIMVELPQTDEVESILKEIERLKKSNGSKAEIQFLKNKLLFIAMAHAKKGLENERAI